MNSTLLTVMNMGSIIGNLAAPITGPTDFNADFNRSEFRG